MVERSYISLIKQTNMSRGYKVNNLVLDHNKKYPRITSVDPEERYDRVFGFMARTSHQYAANRKLRWWDEFVKRDSPYIKDSYRVVVRKYLTRNEVLNKYGNELKREDISKIKELWQDHLDYSNSIYVRGLVNSCGAPATDGIRAGEEITPGYPE